MIIIYRKGTLLNGKNSTILYGYGGFNISETPVFSIPIALWLEMGGVMLSLTLEVAVNMVKNGIWPEQK